MPIPMLPDGSNPEGADPDPPLNWRTKDDLSDVVVHGPAFSHPTNKIRTYLIWAGIPFRHEQHMDLRRRGFKPGTDYRKVPIIDVAGRQVNDSAIIVRYLLPVLGLEYDKPWEDRLVLELDTAFKLHCTVQDWGRMAVATMGLPGIAQYPVGLAAAFVERKQARNNIANAGLGHAEADELAIARDFKTRMRGAFFHGNTPGHVDLSFYGFLAGYAHSRCKIADRVIKGAGLWNWFGRMQGVVPLAKLFP